MLTDILMEEPMVSDEDTMGALHHKIFGYEISCHEGVFRSSSGLVGGPRADQVTEAYHAVDFQPQNWLSSDNLSAELGFLSFLCLREYHAFLGGEKTEASRMRQMQAAFLDHHLLCWLSACSAGVKGCGNPLYGKIAEIMVGITAEHRQHLAAEYEISSPALEQVDVPDLEATHTGLEQVIEYLVIPDRSGLFISHSHLVEIGRVLSLPRGFGSRRQVLRNLFDAAVRYDRERVLIQAIKEMLEGQRFLFETWTQEFQVLGIFHLPWIEKMQTTTALMSVMEAAVTEKDNGGDG